MPKQRDPETGLFIKGVKSYAYLKECPCVEEWITNYAPNTREQYLKALEKFSKWTGLNPEKLLSLSPREAKDLVLRFAKDYAGAGKHGKAISVFNGLKSFYGYHNKKLDFNRYRKQFIRLVRKKVDHELIPDNELVYRLIDVCRRPIDRAVILCLFQSGIRVNALHRLNFGHVKEQLDRGRVPIRLKITSNIDTKLRGVGLSYYYTFIGREAMDALRTYIQQLKAEGKELSEEDPLFLSKYGKRLTMESIYRIVKTAASRLGLKRKIWTHLLRKSFRKVLNKSDLDEDTKEALMGHKLPGSRGNYFDFHDIEEIEGKYKSCNFSREAETTIPAREEIEELEERIRTLELDLTKPIQEPPWVQEMRDLFNKHGVREKMKELAKKPQR